MATKNMRMCSRFPAVSLAPAKEKRKNPPPPTIAPHYGFGFSVKFQVLESVLFFLGGSMLVDLSGSFVWSDWKVHRGKTKLKCNVYSNSGNLLYYFSAIELETRIHCCDGCKWPRLLKRPESRARWLPKTCVCVLDFLP